MAQIELREELEDIGDDADSLARLTVFKGKIASELAALELDFAAQIEHQLAAAEQTTYKMQFMHKLYSEADRLEEQLLDY